MQGLQQCIGRVRLGVRSSSFFTTKKDSKISMTLGHHAQLHSRSSRQENRSLFSTSSSPSSVLAVPEQAKAWWRSFFFHGIMFPYYHSRPLLSVTTFVFDNFHAFFRSASLLGSQRLDHFQIVALRSWS